MSEERDQVREAREYARGVWGHAPLENLRI